MICACVIVVYFSLSFSIMVSCWVLGFCWVSNGGGGGYRAAHHRRAIRFHTDKNKKALSKIPQENKKAVSGRLGFSGSVLSKYIWSFWSISIFYRL